MRMTDPHSDGQLPAKQRLNVTVDRALIADARALRINISRTVEASLREAVRLERDRVWLAENRAAMEANAAWIARHGVPLADKRMF